MRDKKLDWETFTLLKNSDSTYSFLTAHSTFISCDPSKSQDTQCKSTPSIGDQEKWELIQMNNKWCLKLYK
jgi:hypothetical protein